MQGPHSYPTALRMQNSKSVALAARARRRSSGCGTRDFSPSSSLPKKKEASSTPAAAAVAATPDGTVSGSGSGTSVAPARPLPLPTIVLVDGDGDTDLVRATLNFSTSPTHCLLHQHSTHGIDTSIGTVFFKFASSSLPIKVSYIRGHPYMMSAKFGDFLTPSPPVCIWD